MNATLMPDVRTMARCLDRRKVIRGAGVLGIAAVCGAYGNGLVGGQAMASERPRTPELSPTVADVPYVEGGTSQQRLDIYLPASVGASGTPSAVLVPVVVWIHGGGWVGGKKHLSLPYLVEDGYATVTIDYRLLQDAMWPAQIVDANAAVSWVWRHADDYGFDRNRLVVAGGSAGGRSASIVAASANDRVADFAADPEVRIAALIDFFGGTESEYEFAHNPDRTALIEKELTPDQFAEMQHQIDVRTYIDGDDPPTLIVHGDQDHTVPIEEGRELAAAFKAAGVPVTFAEMPGRGHGLHNYQDDAVQQIVRTFLNETLGPARSASVMDIS